MKKKATLFLMLTCLLFLLCSCVPTNRDNGSDNDIDTPKQEPFFDISTLNFNSEYKNENEPEEKGYIIFDAIDFNRITFKANYNRAPRFAIYFEEEFVGSVEKSTSGTVYPTFALNNVGIYMVEVDASSSGLILRDTFTVKVSSGGFPSRVDFQLLNKSRNKVESGKAGVQYYLSAKVYSEDKILEEDSERYSCNWTDGEKGKREMQVTFPNLINDATLSYSFHYSIDKGSYKKNESRTFEIPVANNYAGITFDYGAGFVDGTAIVSVSDYDGTNNFMKSVSAQHNFTNGESKNIPVYYNTNLPNIDTITAFYRYDSGEYNRYAKYDYKSHFDKNITNYVDNGSSYQFDPHYNSVDVYLGYWYNDGQQRKHYKLSGSDATITLTKTPPTAINVISIFGSEKAPGGGSIVFNDREVVNNEVTVKKADLSYYLDWQNFMPSVSLQGATNIPDYRYEILGDGENNPVIIYHRTKKYFYATAIGKSYIKIISCFSDVSYTLCINVVE